ncbi:MAG TPA: DNA-processing protein DprA [Candidatus Saccharimonadales bacterium]|nr:DNA-processing protein DprA [Candidatus Saccharimonadales bacterium]
MSTLFTFKVNKLTLQADGMPEALRYIATPPQELYTVGAPLDELLARPRVAIVGSRKVSPYGREVTVRLARELAERGIVIISGLALGVDALAHQAALDAGGLTIAVLPGPLERIYPASHARLARQIVERGGALVTEYPAGTDTFRWNFIARNRLVSGLSQAVLITEAAEKSGSLHTARFALEQGRDVLAVPGSIFSPTSAGTNNLIKMGAAPVTSYTDVLHALGLEEQAAAARQPHGGTPEEQLLLGLLARGIRDGGTLQLESKLDITQFNQSLTMLELTGKIRSLGAGQWTIN